eukprot:10511210-Heterocapsa_arctica.AAC.1
MQSMPRPLSVRPLLMARSIALAIRTSRSPLATALMAVAILASKLCHFGAMSTKSSGQEPRTSASQSHAVHVAPRPDAEEAIA